jgi:hypothetical protein
VAGLLVELGMGGDVTVDEVRRWAADLDVLQARIGGPFRRSEPRRQAGEYLRGLLAPLERKNGWVRHEAPCARVEVGDLYRRAVAAAG